MLSAMVGLLPAKKQHVLAATKLKFGHLLCELEKCADRVASTLSNAIVSHADRAAYCGSLASKDD